MKSHNSTTFAYLALAAASIIWGANGAVMKSALEFVPLFSLAFIRFGTASILLYFLLKPKIKLDKKDIPLVIFCGLLGITFNISLYFWGLRLTTALNAGIIEASLPLLTLFFLHFVFKRGISKNLLYGGLIGIVGIIVLIGKDFASPMHLSPLGDFLILASITSFMLYELGLKRLFRKYDPLSMTFYSFAVGAWFFLPAASIEYARSPMWITTVPPHIYLNILYGILLSSLAAHACWQWGLSKISLSKVGFFLYLEPFASMIAAVLLLSERITIPFVIGASLIFLGLFLAEIHISSHPHVTTKLHKR